jgi:rod shape-determining protein MreD
VSSLSRAKPHIAPFVGPRWYVAAGWLAIALVVQTTLAHYVAIRGIVPSFVLVVVVWYAIRVDTFRATVYGLAAGLCEDVLSGQTGGAWTVATTVTAILAGALSRGFFADSLPLVGAIVAVATLVRWLLFWTTMGLEGYPGGLGGMHFHEAVAQAFLNVAVMLLAMLAVRRFDVKS